MPRWLGVCCCMRLADSDGDQEDEIRKATRQLLFSARMLAEPSGAVATAAAMFHATELPASNKTAAILTGGNVEPQVFSDMLLQTV